MALQSVPSANHKPLHEIAAEIAADWKKVSPAAQPYLDAMTNLNQIEETYGVDTGVSVVLYFLANATSWRGEKARETKRLLNRIIATRDERLGDKRHRQAYGVE